tara:strand:- start:1138 stop:1890 length:753 start_codon:yes stop_codon:yes gene_type:complete
MTADFLIIIQARLNSTRLPRKVLLETTGTTKKTILEYMYERLINNCDFRVVYAIPESSSDDELANFLEKRKIEFYRGSEIDLLQRYSLGAKNFSAKNIIRLTSDCPLVDPNLIKKMVEFYNKEELDYLGNTTPPDKSTFPDGSDIEIFSSKALERANIEIIDRKYREHVTFQFWDNNSDYESKTFAQNESFSHLRYTIDNPEDILVFNAINENLIFPSKEFCGYKKIQDYLEFNQDIAMLNKEYNPGDNW